jgi:hypothetical protein
MVPGVQRSFPVRAAPTVKCSAATSWQPIICGDGPKARQPDITLWRACGENAVTIPRDTDYALRAEVVEVEVGSGSELIAQMVG